VGFITWLWYINFESKTFIHVYILYIVYIVVVTLKLEKKLYTNTCQ